MPARRTGRARRNQRLPLVIPKPPQYNAEIIVPHRFRFQKRYTGAGGLVTYNINPAKLGALWSMGVTVNTAVAGLFESCKITKIEMWASPPTDGSIITITCNFDGTVAGILGNNSAKSSQTMGMTEPAYLTCKPPARSQAADWQSCHVNGAAGTPSVSTWFTLTIDSPSSVATTISDVTLDLTAVFKISPDPQLLATRTVAVITSIVGSGYFLALDNPASGALSIGSEWVPDRGLPTTS
jgi:hypothetical protein